MQISTPKGPKHVCCGLWSWGGKPLVDGKTHHARKAAHDIFDPLWKDGRLTRTEAYALLSRELGMDKNKCHFGEMTYTQLLKVRDAVQVIKFNLYVVSSNTDK